MISEDFLELLRCPLNHGPLQNADAELVNQLNSAIDAGTVRNRGGEEVDGPIAGGLVDQEKSVLYPVYDDIPCLLVDEAIESDQWEGEQK